ncbi:MAG: PilT/PilU family type 4a pilus ATPase [bacterium]|nr:PilT/PilU family type 4a pilus ATPase [bacterium]
MTTQNKLIIDRILSTMAEQKASDLHFSVGSAPVIRLNNKLISLDNEEIITKEFISDFVKNLLDEDQKKTLEQKKEVVLAFQFQKRARFRVNVFYQKGVLATYFRLIGDTIIPLQKLGLPLTLQQFTQLKKGLILVSGSFGSGKTTTSASMIDYVNQTTSSYVLTIEQPIEYIFQNKKSIVEQREVGRDTISFEQALSTITQEDVDLLFISELTSKKIIKEILNIAASGRLVIANMEADTIIKTLELLIYSFPTNEQQQIREELAITLAGIICQRLVPKIGGTHIAVAEILTSTAPIQSLIKEGSLYQIGNIIQTSRAEGMVSLDWSLAELVKSNQITLEDALNNATDPQQLKYMLRT